jgi:HSP20 family protein
MYREPMDMFEEMDKMFERLFYRMDREFITGSPQEYGYPVMVWNDGEELSMQEPADENAPALISSEPTAEVHHIGNEVKVIADLPGITEDALRLDLKGSTLVIDAGDADHHYRTSAELPPVDTGSMRMTLKNGVLEVTFTSLPEPSGKT